MDSNNNENLLGFLSLGFLPLLVIGIAIVGWLIVGIFWVVALFINLLTIFVGGFVIIPIEWIFLLADWILSWLGPFIGGYFTRTHFFNWLNNLYLLGFTFVIGLVSKFTMSPSIDLKKTSDQSNIGHSSEENQNLTASK